MKPALLSALVSVCVLLSACGDKTKNSAAAGQPKDVPKVVAAEAEHLASDASFAMQIRDYARAETGLARAVQLRSDIPGWWVDLGAVRKRLGKTSDARSAYKKALALYEDRYAATSDPQDVKQQLIVLVLLGRESDARKLLDRVYQKQPDHPLVKIMRTQKIIDLMLADPDMRQIRL